MKKLLASILATTMLIGGSICAFAQAQGNVIDTNQQCYGAGSDPQAPVQRYSMNGINAYNFSNFNPSSIRYKTIAVPHYKQETNYYCAPATLKQTLQYINGKSLSQSTYASSSYLNTEKVKFDGKRWTTDTKMLSNLNALQTSTEYDQGDVDSKEKLLYYISEDLNTKDVPTILIIKTINSNNTKTNEWSYKAPGHFLNASGLKASGTDIEVVDPYITWVVPAERDGTYWMKTQNVYQAVINHPCQAVQW